MENLKKELADLEVKIEQYPLGESPRLIDEFLIMGYTDIIKYEKVINPIKSEISLQYYNDLDFLKEHTINHLPALLSSITSNANHTIIDTQNLINYVFPIPQKIYYSNQGKNIKEPEISKVIFNNIHNGIVNIGYAYCFYEKDIIKLNENEKYNLVFYFPKAFVIVSQYNYFYTFHKICENLHKQYLSDKIEIPIEIQIYNIVNFIPCPLDNKLELSIFPPNELSSIIKCKDFNEYKKLNDSNNYLFLEQLGGYNHSEINFCKILEILTPEVITQVYLQLFCGKTVAFFSEKKEILNYVLFVFSHFLFPLAGKESVFGLNPNKYYSGEILDHFIVGFLSSYLIIEFFDPMPKDAKKKNFLIFEDEKSAQKDRRGFEKVKVKCDFILNIEDGSFSLYEEPEKKNIKEEKEEKEREEEDDDEFCDSDNDMIDKDKKQEEIQRNKFLYEYFKMLFDDKLEGNIAITLDILIRELFTKIKSLSMLDKDENLNSFFFVENEKIKSVSEQIQEAFLKFNLLVCDNYFRIFSSYKGGLNKDVFFNKKPREELGITEAEYYFYDNFEHSSNRDMLMNFIVGYDENEPTLPKATKRGFDNLLAMCKEEPNNSLLLKEHYIELLDCIYIKNNTNNIKSISFFEFYKYFYDNLRLFVYKNINDDFLNKKVIKKDNINYYYKYKKINIDQELLLKYCYYLEELFDKSEDIKKKLFPATENSESIKKIISTKDYYNSYDSFLINHKIINLKNIIQFCILNIVILSSSELKLIHFTGPIYEMIRKMNFGVRKYVELILNVSYRVFIKNNITNINEAKVYFDIYKIGMEEKTIFPNDEIIVLEENIKKYMDLLKDETIIKPEIISHIEETEEKHLFSFEPEKIDKSELDNEIGDNLEKEGKMMKKLILNSALLNNEEITSDCILYPYSLYLKLNELTERYYQTLDINSVGRNEYNKLIINVIYYLRLIKGNFPQGIFRFLFYCLCKEDESK